jgi:hypothetical protein
LNDLILYADPEKVISTINSMMYKFFSIRKWLFILFPALNFQICFSQTYDAELINLQTIIEVREGKLVQTHFFEIKINNRNGDEYAEVSIPFDKIHKVSNIEASISDISGNVVKKLKKSDIIEKSQSSDFSFFADNYVKEFALRNHTYPYTLKYSYRSEESQFMYIAHWLPVIDNEIPTRQAKLQLSTPGGYRLAFNSNLTDRPKIDSIPGRIFYTWQTSYPKPVLDVTWAPPLQQFMPYVDIAPEKFRYELEGSNKSWESFGNWNLSLLNGLDDLPLTEKIKIHSLTDSIQDEKKKIRILFHYLQDATRYINVSIKTGGMKPFPASYVAEKKYGDCKALSNYFKSCLSVINIAAFYTTINAGDVIESFYPDFPSQQFNHVILYVPLKNDTLWVDCTSDLAFGYLGTFTQNRPALVLKDSASALIMTPALKYDDVLEKRKISVKMNSAGVVKADFKNTYRGYIYELLSSVMTSLSESERIQYLGRKIVETGFQMDKYSVSAPERDTPEITLEYTASSDHMMKSYGTESLVEIIPIKFPFLEEPKKRKLPVQVNYPINRIDSIEYVIPENYKISVVPKNIAICSAYGEYQAYFEVKGHTVLAIKHVKINYGSYPLDEYQKFYSFMKSIAESESSFYIALLNN